MRLTIPGEVVQEGAVVMFQMPTDSGKSEWCWWSAQAWEVRDCARRGEPKSFRDWLRAELKRRNFTAKGVSMACGLSYGWLPMILAGKNLLPKKHEAALEQAIGLKPGAIGRKRKECTL